jgi:hypothetical protein
VSATQVSVSHMRAVLAVEGVFRDLAHTPENRVRIMWRVRESEEYRTLLEQKGWTASGSGAGPI